MAISHVSGHNPGVESVVKPVVPQGVEPPADVRHLDEPVRGQNFQQEVESKKNEQLAVKQLENQSLDKAVEQLNAVLASMDRHLRFSIDKPSGRTVVKFIDNKSNEVIKQIPPDEILSLSAKIKELIGILFDKRS
jgi:flagellar protein FlaG